MEIKINVLFWQSEEDKQRLANVNLCWFYLNKFCDYAKDKGLEIKPVLFDFSEEKVLDNAVHIPYPKGSYLRAEKINRVIDYYQDNCIFSIMDSDIIFKEKDYDTLIYLLKNIKKDKFYVFQVEDLQNLDGVDYENNNIEFDKVNSSLRNYNPSLGGVFVIHKNILLEAGKFDEKSFVTYGGEDDDISMTIEDLGYKKVLLPINPLHLPHTSLAIETVKTPQYQKQLTIVMNKINNRRK